METPCHPKRRNDLQTFGNESFKRRYTDKPSEPLSINSEPLLQNIAECNADKTSEFTDIPETLGKGEFRNVMNDLWKLLHISGGNEIKKTNSFKGDSEEPDMLATNNPLRFIDANNFTEKQHLVSTDTGSSEIWYKYGMQATSSSIHGVENYVYRGQLSGTSAPPLVKVDEPLKIHTDRNIFLASNSPSLSPPYPHSPQSVGTPNTASPRSLSLSRTRSRAAREIQESWGVDKKVIRVLNDQFTL